MTRGRPSVSCRRRPFVAAAGETVPALYDADASLAPGAPFLTVMEPVLLLLAFALGALGRFGTV